MFQETEDNDVPRATCLCLNSCTRNCPCNNNEHPCSPSQCRCSKSKCRNREGRANTEVRISNVLQSMKNLQNNLK